MHPESFALDLEPGASSLCRIILADIAMIVLGLFGALSTNQYRWGYFAISCLFFLIVLWGLFSPVARVRPKAVSAVLRHVPWLHTAILHIAMYPA